MEVDENKPVVEESEEVVIKKEPNETVDLKIGHEETVRLNKENGDSVQSSETTVNENKCNDLHEKIIRQIEYYFGDHNLPRDQFLKEQILLDEGWISVDSLFKFPRLARLTSNGSVILEALKKSTSGLMEVCEKQAKIRRSKEKPLPEDTPERISEVKNRTVYCKGFPRDGMHIDRILEFFNQFPVVENAKMRYFTDKQNKKIYKGSVLVTFETRLQAEKFLNQEVIKFNDYVIARQWNADWELEKTAEFQARKAMQSEKANKHGKSNGKNNSAKNENKIVLPRGTMLKLSGLPADTNRNNIKEVLISHSAEVGFVDVFPDNSALVRLRKENEAKLLLSKLDNGKVTIGDISVDVSALEGDEEEEFLKKAEEHLNSNSAQAFRGGRGGRRGGRRGNGRGGRGGRGGYKGKRRGNDTREPEDHGNEGSLTPQEPFATPETTNIKREPSTTSDEKRQGSPETGTPAKRTRVD